MRTMKWETVKDKAIAYLVGNDLLGTVERLGFCALMASIGNQKRWRDNMEEVKETAVRIIERWDVRRAKALIDLCPEIVPAHCRGKVPRCYAADNENSEWMVEFD